jgi:lysozyme
MDLKQLKTELAIDEGIKHEIYKDHLGYPTFGIGHLVLKSDPEYGQQDGTPITEERVTEVFEKDCESVLLDCVTLYDAFYTFPEEVQLILANMMFNMGRTRLSKFKNFKKAVDDLDWKQAATEGRDSNWYKQVTNRAERLMVRMENVV